jgi:hypothetical protein
MKFGELKSVGHNIADSLASGIGLMIGICEMDVFGEAAASKEGFIEVDFLTGAISGAKPSRLLARAARLYAEALPRLCERHGVSVSDFRALKARFSGTRMSQSFLVTVEGSNGRRSRDEYFGVPGKRARVLDPLGRIRTKRSGG